MTSKFPLLPTLLAAVALALTAPAAACTAFLLEGPDGPRVGKSYDWHTTEGRVLHNKRGVAKRALTVDPRDTPHAWTSVYSSVTFVQYGRDLPNGGMNDAGLVVEVLWLDEAVAEARDARPVVNELQWIQHQLDTRRTTAEVVQHLGGVRVSPVAAAVHYFVCDVTGDCAVIESLAGGVTVSRGDRAITNDTASASRGALARNAGSTGRSSLARYVRTARAVTTPGGRERAFELLGSVEQSNYTRWQLVYEPKAQRVAFRTTATGTLHVIDVASLARQCSSPVLSRDLDTGTNWSEWRESDNQELVTSSFARLGGRVAALAGAVAAWPGRSVCTAR